MKRILLILVGGTICTDLNEQGTLSVSGSAGIHLKANFENSDSVYVGKVQINLSKNLYILSENMTVEQWNLMLDTYREYTRKEQYDGIIFAHGTDTLAYSAALFSMILSGTDVPVFFVSAHQRLDLPDTNGNDNFRYAVECICRGISPNVYVTYKNISDGQMYLHLASRLEQCADYSDDFYSTGAVNITDISEENYREYFERLDRMYPAGQAERFADVYGDWHLQDRVLMLRPYVGINYEAYDYSRFAAVLHGTYHSGTACAEKTRHSSHYGCHSILKMIDRCAALEPPVDTYLAPARRSGEVYETVGIIGGHTAKGRKISFLYGCTTEMAYAKLVLAYSLLTDRQRIVAFMQTQYNFEFIHQIPDFGKEGTQV